MTLQVWNVFAQNSVQSTCMRRGTRWQLTMAPITRCFQTAAVHVSKRLDHEQDKKPNLHRGAAQNQLKGKHLQQSMSTMLQSNKCLVDSFNEASCLQQRKLLYCSVGKLWIFLQHAKCSGQVLNALYLAGLVFDQWRPLTCQKFLHGAAWGYPLSLGSWDEGWKQRWCCKCHQQPCKSCSHWNQ